MLVRLRIPDAQPGFDGVLVVAGIGLGWGLLTGIAAGAWFGTLIIPVAGTLFGAAFGGVFAVTPTLVCTIVAAMVLATVDRRDPDPLRVRRHLAAWSAATSGFVALVGASLVRTLFRSGRGGWHSLASWWVLYDVFLFVSTVGVVVAMLRLAAGWMATAWLRRWGWEPEPFASAFLAGGAPYPAPGQWGLPPGPPGSVGPVPRPPHSVPPPPPHLPLPPPPPPPPPHLR